MDGLDEYADGLGKYENLVIYGMIKKQWMFVGSKRVIPKCCVW